MPFLEKLYEQMELVEQRYPNGQLEVREFYWNGKLEGEHKIWHENGQLMSDQIYWDGKPEGKYKSWYENGRPSAITSLRAGLGEGEFRHWDRDGCPYWFHWCKNGDAIDYEFTFQKKRIWLKLRRMVMTQLIRDKYIANLFLISDLTNLLEI